MRENVELKIEHPRAVFRDFVANRWWVAFAWLVIGFWMVFSASLFWYVEHDAQTLTWGTSFYFTVINCTTVGFGDIFPKTGAGQVLAVLNSLIGFLAFGLILSIVSLALQPSQPSPPSEEQVLETLVKALVRVGNVEPIVEPTGRFPRIHIYIEFERG